MAQRILTAAPGLSRRPWTLALHSQIYRPLSLPPCACKSHAAKLVHVERFQNATFSCGRLVRQENGSGETQSHGDAAANKLFTTYQEGSGADADASKTSTANTQSGDDSPYTGSADKSQEMGKLSKRGIAYTPVLHESIVKRFSWGSTDREVDISLLSRGQALPQAEDLSTKSQICSALDHFSQNSSLQGLAWWAAAALHASSILPPHLDYQIAQSSMRPLLARDFKALFGRRDGKEFITLLFNNTRRSYASSAVPIKIMLYTSIDKSHTGFEDPTGGSLRDEMMYFSDLINMVTDYCKTINVRDEQSYASMVAESLLRVLDFRTTGLFLTTVIVKLVPSAKKTSAELRATTTKVEWEDTPTRPLKPNERKTEKVRVVTGDPDSKHHDEDEASEFNDLVDIEGADEAEEARGTNHLIDLETNGAGSGRSVIDKASSKNDGSAQSESLVSDILQLEGSSGYAGSIRPLNRIQSSIFQAKTGFHSCDCSVLYRRDEHARHLGNLSVGDISDAVDKAFRSSDSSGFALVQEAAIEVSKMLPCSPRVFLTAYSFRSSFLRTPNKQSAFTYSQGSQQTVTCESGPAIGKINNAISEASEPGSSIARIVLPTLGVKAANSNRGLVLALTIRGVCISGEIALQETPLARMKRMCALLEPKLDDVLRNAHTMSLNKIVEQCCFATARLDAHMNDFQIKEVKGAISTYAKGKCGYLEKGTRFTLPVTPGLFNNGLDSREEKTSSALGSDANESKSSALSDASVKKGWTINENEGYSDASPDSGESNFLRGTSSFSSAKPIKSKVFLEKTGFGLFGFNIVWKAEHASMPKDLNEHDIRRAAKTAFRDSAQSGLARIRGALARLRELLPHCEAVSLRLFGDPEFFSPLPDSPADFAYRPNGYILRFTSKNYHALLEDSQHIAHEFDLAPGRMMFYNVRPDELLRLDLRLRGTVGDSQAASQDNASIIVRRIFATLEPDLVGILRTTKCLALQDVAQRIVTAAAAHLRSSFAHDSGGESRDATVDAAVSALRMGQKFHSKGVKVTQHVWSGEDNSVIRHEPVSCEISNNPPQSSMNNGGVQSQEENIFVALGSNVGDRIRAIEAACRAIDDSDDMQILETSPLYETEPMYVEDQERFLNGMCRIKTSLEPMELLDRLQAIENDLGRVKLIDKGPRNIDLDIVAYGNRIIDTERLIVPHRLMTEREFVLRPLCALSPGLTHPRTKMSVSRHLKALPTSAVPIYPLTPIGPSSDGIRATDPRRRTHIMSILNVTPDSFSDGGENQPADIEALKATVMSHIAAGATIIDVGGQSSRPGAPDITAEEELNRILPVIETIKSLPEAAHIAISVDTYRATVAEAAVNAGAHIVNDISAGTLDPEMLPTIARLRCTYIMMHMRGTPATMQSPENTSYPKNIFKTIIRELHARVRAAQEAGIRAWRIVLDPGIGFSKTTDQNLQILRAFVKMQDSKALSQYPWLVGSSRKRFIGEVTGVEDAKDRVFGTAVTVTAAIRGGADIVRVHDVKEMVQTAKMADAIYRAGKSDKEVEESGAS